MENEQYSFRWLRCSYLYDSHCDLSPPNSGDMSDFILFDSIDCSFQGSFFSLLLEYHTLSAFHLLHWQLFLHLLVYGHCPSSKCCPTPRFISYFLLSFFLLCTLAPLVTSPWPYIWLLVCMSTQSLHSPTLLHTLLRFCKHFQFKFPIPLLNSIVLVFWAKFIPWQPKQSRSSPTSDFIHLPFLPWTLQFLRQNHKTQPWISFLSSLPASSSFLSSILESLDSKSPSSLAWSTTTDSRLVPKLSWRT